ncbi:uncharacterized protein JCM15063_001841 [Sporobolomyces koalae]|uniref:uncharacterized protein n=1 Tax=Sporobolomyces koalae TaxID=500713 RepID=UPI00317D7038
MTTTRSQDLHATTGDKREAAEHSSHASKKQKKVVVQKDTNDKSEGSGSEARPKQQKLTTAEEQDGTEGNVESDNVGSKVGENEQDEQKPSSGKDAGHKDESHAEQLASRQQGEEDHGGNAEPGEKPHLEGLVNDGDYKRKHGILETGHVYFLYRPKVEVNEPHSLDDIARFHLLLVPHGSKLHRLLAIGKKTLPDHEQSSRPMWGEVLNVGDDMQALKENLASYTYETKTMGTRHQPGSRVAASGVYVLHATENYPKDSSNANAVWATHFAYKVALPHEMGEVQEALHIHPEGIFSLQVKNPEAPSTNPAAPTQDPSKNPRFPESLESLFKTKFIPADPPALLDYPGAELLLIPSKHKVAEDIGQDAEKELGKEEQELEREIEQDGKTDAVKRALDEMGLEGLIEGKALEGHWE